jgi:hypothetical protein
LQDSQPDGARPPIFIVGSPRSGTSLTRLVIDSHPAIACGPETHFLADLEMIVTRHWRRLERAGFDKQYWYARCRDLYVGYQRDYAASKGKTRWADKTPRYAQHLPFVLELFPDAQIVHVIRNADAVVSSWAKRWGWRSALSAPRAWVDNVRAARAVGKTLPASQYRELRFEDLVADPERCLRPLFEWFGEPWDARVLDYDRQEHDGGGKLEQITTEARKSTGSAINSQRARPARLSLPLRVRTRYVAGALNRELGY